MAKEPETAIAKEEMVTVMIDPKITRGGLKTATLTGWKNYVGKVTVPAHLAEDLLRRQTEFGATVQKLTEENLELRNQNINTTRAAFMADIAIAGSNPQFTRENGMASRFQMQFIAEKDLAEWKEERMGLFGY
jgi:hypothetical protein